jgi:membrane complex biogenesis BtpA family protein
LISLFEERKKVVVGMAHFPPLPGTPLYDTEKHTHQAIRNALEHDLLALQRGGIDAVMFGNENDRPYTLKVDRAVVAAMSFTIGELSSRIEVPFGVDLLWDARAALAVAKAVGASFIREVVSGVYVSDMGLWDTSAGELFRYRKLLDGGDIAVLFNISAEFASSLDSRPLQEVARSVVFSSLADAVLISGPMTGRAPDREALELVKAVVDVPVLINTGLNAENVRQLLEPADGAIVGTSLKRDGVTWNPVDESRVEVLMREVEKLR